MTKTRILTLYNSTLKQSETTSFSPIVSYLNRKDLSILIHFDIEQD